MCRGAWPTRLSNGTAYLEDEMSGPNAITKKIPLPVPENPPIRWQKITIALGAVGLVLLGLIAIILLANTKMTDAKFIEVVKAYGMFCGVVPPVAIAAIVGNVGEHVKNAMAAVANRLTGPKGPSK